VELACRNAARLQQCGRRRPLLANKPLAEAPARGEAYRPGLG